MTFTIADVSVGDTLPPLNFVVSATRLVAGALASRDYSPLHHDKSYVEQVAGQRDIFANTQFQSALFDRYVCDWAGPMARIARMQFRMRSSVFAGDEARISGVVTAVRSDDSYGPAATVALELTVADRRATTCEILVALPAGAGDNPWAREGAPHAEM